MRIGYAKIGRSMPLSLDKCGNLGGDVEMAAVAGEFARRHPGDEIVLIGRNTGERPEDVGLPDNVSNPWRRWGPELKAATKSRGIVGEVLTPELQFDVARCFRDIGVIETIANLDGLILWVGQHGTSNLPIPKISDPTQLTKPQDWCVWYASYLFTGVNEWRDRHGPLTHEEIYLNADARNRHKMRDLKWPLRHPILTQYTFDHPLKHYRYGDGSGFDEWYAPGEVDVAEDGMHTSDTWKSRVRNVYSRLEVNGLRPNTPFGDLISYDESFAGRREFGLFINEARAIGVRPELARKHIMREWILPMDPHFIHGTWSRESLAELELADEAVRPAPWDDYYPKLHSVLATLTTPSSGSGWATAKPWEAFAAGTVCFFHPAYDTQDNILGDAPDWLRAFLRVETPRQLRQHVYALSHDRDFWLRVVRAQRLHFDVALEELAYMTMIEERLFA